MAQNRIGPAKCQIHPRQCVKSRTVGVLIAANDDIQDILNICRSEECTLEQKAT